MCILQETPMYRCQAYVSGIMSGIKIVMFLFMGMKF